MARLLNKAAVIVLLLTAAWMLVAGESSGGRVVRVGVFPFEPGIFMDANGQAQGFFVDMLGDVAREQGWELVYVPGTWAQGLERVQRGEVDLLTSVARTPEREAFLRFGQASAFTVWSILYRNPGVPIESIMDVRGRRVALMRNDVNGRHFVELCRRFDLPFQAVEVGDFTEVLGAVESGQVDAGVVVGPYGYAREGDFRVARTAVVFDPFDIHFAVARGRNEEVIQALDAYVQEGRAVPGSAYHRHVDRWLNPGRGRSGLPRWVLPALAAVLAALGLAVAAVAVFRRQVRRATQEIRALNAELRQELAERARSEAARLELEKQVLHVQKLESLGLLAGGIAHDFNNLLTAMLGHLNVVASRLDLDHPGRANVASLEQIVQRAAALTRQMLAYSGRGRFLVRGHDLNQVLRETVELLEVALSKKVGLRFQLADDLPVVRADAAQLQQVLMNLVTNAADAIGDHEGTIQVRTWAEDLDGPALAALPGGFDLVPGRYACLEVEDTGCGMAPEVLARIFDPFFTTKASGHGLGLSATLGILKGHGGACRIRSEVGRGTAFQVLFPADPEARLEPEPAQAGPVDLSRAVVLLVDDEPMIRDATSEVLALLGVRVLTADNGLEAVQCLESGGAEVNVVLMDLSMPVMDGREAYARIRALRPDLPVVLCSGYDEREADGDDLRGVAAFLHKPYALQDLAATLEAALGRSLGA